MATETTGPQRVHVRYFVPEDGDAEATPNVFTITADSKRPRLADITKAFPLPGTYFFRFKAALGTAHGTRGGGGCGGVIVAPV